MKAFKEVKKKKQDTIQKIQQRFFPFLNLGRPQTNICGNAHSRPSPTRVWGPKTQPHSGLSQSQQGSKTASASADPVITKGELLGPSTKKRADENKDKI